MLLLYGINNYCWYCTLYSEEGIEGDVISNPTTAEDDPETSDVCTWFMIIIMHQSTNIN